MDVPPSTRADHSETTSQRSQLRMRTNGSWRAGRGWELMVGLSGRGSANGKWEVIREKRLVCVSPSGKQSGEPGLPTASFIIVCLAGGSESGQTEQTPSIFLLLLVCLLFLLIFCHFYPLLLILQYFHLSLSSHLICTFFLSSLHLP